MITYQPRQMPTNSSRLIAPSPSKSNSSIIAIISSSCNPSPSSRATLLRSCKLMAPLPSPSNRSKARNISSLGSLARYLCAAMATNAAWGSTRRAGPLKVALSLFRGCGAFEFELAKEIPCVWRRVKISDFGRSKPRALRATLSS